MSSEIKVSDLYAAIGFEVDKADLTKAERQIDQFAGKVEQKLQKTGKQIQRALTPSVMGGGSYVAKREEYRRDAALWKSEQIKRQRIHERMTIQSQGRIRRALAGAKGKFGAGIGMGGGLGGLGGLAAGVVGTQVLRDEFGFQKNLTALGVASNGSMGPTDKVRKSVIDASNDTAVAKDQILEGASAFVALTGDGKTAAAAMRTFGRVAKATGSDVQDIAGTAAAMQQQLGIGPQQFEKAFSVLIAGGKAGSIEMKDMAQFSAELASQFKTFQGGTGVRGLADMSAAFQIAAQNFGGKAPETATGMKALFSAFTTPRTLKALKQMHVEIFKVGKDGKAQLKSFPEIFEAMAKTDIIKDPRLLTKVFESSEARRAASAILGNVDAFKKLSAEIMRANDVNKDFATVMESQAGRMESAWNRVKNAAADAANTALNMGLGLGEGLGTGAAYVADKLGIVDTRSDAQKSEEGRSFWQGKDNEFLQNYAATHADSMAESAQSELRRREREKQKAYVYQADKEQFGTGDRLSPSYYEPKAGNEPFRYEPPGGWPTQKQIGAMTANVTVNVGAGADGHEIGNIVTKQIRQVFDQQARDIAAAGGQ